MLLQDYQNCIASTTPQCVSLNSETVRNGDFFFFF